MNEQNEIHTLTERHIVETRWFCTNRERCDELDKLIASAAHHLNTLSQMVAEKWEGEKSGLIALEREATLTMMLKTLRDERKGYWRRAKREIDETVDETGKVIATTRRVVAARRVDSEPPVFEAALIEPSVEGKPLVRIRNI